MQSLTQEVSGHNARIEKILQAFSETDFGDFFEAKVFLPALLNIPVKFENGEMWTLTKIEPKTWQNKLNPSDIVYETVFTFKDDSGSRSKYRTYFGGAHQKSERILKLYEDELNHEWHLRKKPSVILDAIERFFLKEN